MNLNESQKQAVTAWVADGMKLSEIQNRLVSEFGLRMTYMEVRFLVDDLKLKLADPEPPKPATPAPTSPPAATRTDDALPGPDAEGVEDSPSPGAGKVSVTVDQLTRPGALVSGKVKFSDGANADWYLDQTGRLGVVPQQQGYKPSALDVQEFQMALEREMVKLGF
ncbi:MAG TPA: hypothetical protein VFZ59_04560 [Verrucomicrobiae bacterium]|nr:hypothetical protein [Verrucomicrobiae bacterium]